MISLRCVWCGLNCCYVEFAIKRHRCLIINEATYAEPISVLKKSRSITWNTHHKLDENINVPLPRWGEKTLPGRWQTCQHSAVYRPYRTVWLRAICCIQRCCKPPDFKSIITLGPSEVDLCSAFAALCRSNLCLYREQFIRILLD